MKLDCYILVERSLSNVMIGFEQTTLLSSFVQQLHLPDTQGHSSESELSWDLKIAQTLDEGNG